MAFLSLGSTLNPYVPYLRKKLSGCETAKTTLNLECTCLNQDLRS